MKKIAFVLLAAALAVPSFAASAAGSDQGAAAPKPKKAKMICRRTQGTGSHMQTRICKTETEWADADAHDQDTLEMRNEAQKTGCGGEMGACSPSRGGPH